MRVSVLASLLMFAACGGGGMKSPADFSSSSDAGHGDLAKSDAAMASGWVFGGASAMGSFSGSGATINLAASSLVTGTVSFAVTAETGSGTVTITDALNHALQTTTADVTPDNLPVDNANPNDTNPYIYFSFANAGSSPISITAASLTVTPTAASSFATNISASAQCEFDTFNASTSTWTSQGVSANFTGPQTSYTVPNIVLSGSITLAVGQTIGAFICD
jgi:hypothetical protein